MLNREIRLTDKLKKGLLLVFFYLSFSEDILNFIWHGFHNQYGIPNRFSFLYGFVLLVMLFEVLEHRECIRNWQVVLGCLAGVGLLFVSRNWAESPLEDGIYGVAGMLMMLYGLILFVMSFDKRHQKWHVTAFSVIAVAEMCVTSVWDLNISDRSACRNSSPGPKMWRKRRGRWTTAASTGVSWRTARWSMKMHGILFGQWVSSVPLPQTHGKDDGFPRVLHGRQ